MSWPSACVSLDLDFAGLVEGEEDVELHPGWGNAWICPLVLYAPTTLLMSVHVVRQCVCRHHIGRAVWAVEGRIPSISTERLFLLLDILLYVLGCWRERLQLLFRYHTRWRPWIIAVVQSNGNVRSFCPASGHAQKSLNVLDHIKTVFPVVHPYLI